MYVPSRLRPDRRPPAVAAVVSDLYNVPLFAVDACGEEETESEAEAENPDARVAAYASASPSIFSVIKCDRTPPSIKHTASFTVETFWIESPQGLIVGDGGGKGEGKGA